MTRGSSGHVRAAGERRLGCLTGACARFLLTLANRAALDHLKGHDTRRTFGTLATEASGDELLAIRLMRNLVLGVSTRYVVRDLPKLLGRYAPLRLIRGTSVGMAGVDEGLRGLESPSQVAGVRMVPPGRLELPPPASEAGALSD